MVKYSRTFCGELSDAPRRTRWANAWRAAARICSVAAGSEAPSAPWIKRLWFDIVVLRSFRAGLPESGGVPSQRSRHRLAVGHPASRGTRAAREQRSALIGENDGIGSREEASPIFFCVCSFPCDGRKAPPASPAGKELVSTRSATGSYCW